MKYKKYLSELETYKAILENAKVGVNFLDLKTGKYVYLNPTQVELTGFNMEEINGITANEALKRVHPKDRNVSLEQQKLIAQGIDSEKEVEYRWKVKNGKYRYFSDRRSLIKNKNGEIVAMMGISRDITDQKNMEAGLEKAKETQLFFDVNPDLMGIANSDGYFLKINKSFEKILGYTEFYLKSRKFFELIHPKDLEKTKKAMSQVEKKGHVTNMVNMYKKADGKYIYIEWSAKKYDGLIYFTGRDITEKVNMEEQLKKSATTDGLTGLHNRNYLESIISEEMNRSDRYGESLCILLLDLDHFKSINDTWGHDAGDNVLKRTANIIQDNIRNSDIAVRIGGEEFLILLPKTAMEGAINVGEKIRTAVENNVHPVMGKQTVSMGIAERMSFETFRHWYKRADNALYKAKSAGRNLLSLSIKKDALKESIKRLNDYVGITSGNELIDQEHRQLKIEILDLAAISDKTHSKKELNDKINLLIESIYKHFENEINILKKIKYPDWKEHEENHDNLLQKTKNLQKITLKKNDLDALLSFIIDEIILQHTVEEDVDYIPFMNKSN